MEGGVIVTLQQILYNEFIYLEFDMNKDFNAWREQIQSIDSQVIGLLEQRFDLVAKIGHYKKQNGLPVRDEEREKILIQSVIKNTKLDQNFIRDFYQNLFTYAYLIEQ